MLLIKTKDAFLLHKLRERLILNYKFHNLDIPVENRKEYIAQNLIIKKHDLIYTGQITKTRFENRSTEYWYNKSLAKVLGIKKNDKSSYNYYTFNWFEYTKPIHTVLFVRLLFSRDSSVYTDYSPITEAFTEPYSKPISQTELTNYITERGY